MFVYEDAVRDATSLLSALGFDDAQFTGETEQSDSGEMWLPFTTQYFDQPTVVVDSEGNVRLEPWTYLIYPEAALETKAARYVRTPEGRRRYGQEIGTLIVRDIIPHHPWMQRGSEAARRVAQRREQRRTDAFARPRKAPPGVTEFHEDTPQQKRILRTHRPAKAVREKYQPGMQVQSSAAKPGDNPPVGIVQYTVPGLNAQGGVVVVKWPNGQIGRHGAISLSIVEPHIDAFSGKPEEYRGGHQAAGRDFGSPMYDPEDMMPDLLKHPEWYHTGYDKVDRESFAAIRKAVRGGPDTKITVYRAVPKGVDKINPGDWVTPSREYAEIHAEGNLGGTHDPDTGDWVPNPSDILSMEARAGDLWFEGNSIAEWGWAPEGTDAFTKMEKLGPVRRFNRWLSQPGGGRVPRLLPHNLPVPKAPTHTSERYTPSIRFPGWDVYTIQGHPVRVWELDDGRITAFAPDLDFEELESPVFEGTTVDEALQGFIDHMHLDAYSYGENPDAVAEMFEFEPGKLNQFREDNDQGAYCDDIAHAVEEKFGWEQQYGVYTTDDGRKESHSWNHDGDTIIDFAADQFGDQSSGPRVLRPGDEFYDRYVDQGYGDWGMPVDDQRAPNRVRFESRLIEADKVHELPEQDGVTVRWIEVASPTLGAPMFDDEGNQVSSGYFVPRRGMIGTSDNDQIEVRAVFGVPARGRLGEYAVWVTGQRGEIPSQLAEMQKRYARTKPGLVKRKRVPVDETFRKEDLYHETSDDWVNGLQRAGITQAQWEHMVLVEGTVSTGVPSTRTRGYVNAVMGHYKRKYGSISPLVGKVRITNETINGYDNDYAAFNRDDAFTSPIHGTRASSINLNTRYFPAEGHDETNARHIIHLDSLENEHTTFSSVDVPAVAKHLGITEQDAYALAVMHHEVGHAISNLLLGDNEQFVDGLPRDVRLIMEATRIAMWQMLDKMAIKDFAGQKTLDPEKTTRNVSGYAAKNLHEHMAEIWAAYNLMPQVTKYEQQMGRMMDETFKIIAANLPPDPTPEEFS